MTHEKTRWYCLVTISGVLKTAYKVSHYSCDTLRATLQDTAPEFITETRPSFGGKLLDGLWRRRGAEVGKLPNENKPHFCQTWFQPCLGFS